MRQKLPVLIVACFLAISVLVITTNNPGHTTNPQLGTSKPVWTPAANEPVNTGDPLADLFGDTSEDSAFQPVQDNGPLSVAPTEGYVPGSAETFAGERKWYSWLFSLFRGSPQPTENGTEVP